MTHSRGSKPLALFVAFVCCFAAHIAARAQPGYKYLEQSLSPSFTTLRTYTFDTGTEGWSPYTFTGYSVPEYSWQEGKLAMKATGSTALFGFWQSCESDIITSSGQLYYAIFEASTDVVDRSMVPQMRILAADWEYAQCNEFFVTSLGDGGFSPLTGNYGYYFCFESCSEAAGAGQYFHWDMLNFYQRDDPWGSLYLDSARVFAAPLDSLTTPTVVKVWDFDTGLEGWIAPDVFPPFWLWAAYSRIEDLYPKAIATVPSDCLQLKPGVLIAYGYWQSPFEVEIKPSKMYVAQFFLRADHTEPLDLPQIYLSVVSQNWQCVVQKLVTCSYYRRKCWSGTVDAEEFCVYFVPSRHWVGTRLGFLFQIGAFSSGGDPNAAVMLDKLVVKEMDLIVPMALTAARPDTWLLYE